MTNKTIGDKKDILNYYKETKPIKNMTNKNFINKDEIEYYDKDNERKNNER
jgi:hypothetical protein